MIRSLKALPLTAARFAPFGEVLEATVQHRQTMNDARFERYRDLARVDMAGDKGVQPSISIARCRAATAFPYRLEMLERHPNSSQAFMPLSNFSFVVVVAPPAEAVDAGAISAFITNGRQGINYHTGVWHMPMTGMQSEQEFLIVDRAEDSALCDEHFLADPVIIEL